MKNKDALTKEDKKMLNSIFLRSFAIFAGRSGGQVRQHVAGFIYCLLQVLIVTIKMILKGVVKRWSDILCFITLLKI